MPSEKHDDPDVENEGEVTFSDAEARVDALLRLQTDCIRRAKQALTNFKSDGPARKTLRIYFTTKMSKFGEIVALFEENHRQLVRLIPSDGQAEYEYFKLDFPTKFEDAQFEFITTVQTAHDERFPENRAPPANENATHLVSSSVLPTVTIPQFSGTHTEWKTFRDLFRSIVHTNDKLPNSHKFQYLLGALSGEARDLVSGFEVCDDDYLKAWQALTTHYDDKPTMFMRIMGKFVALAPIIEEQPDRLRELLKATSSCLKSLAAVGVDKDKVDSVITYLLIRKLPANTIAYWEQVRDRKLLPSFEFLQSCIETRIRVARIAYVGTSDSGASSRAETNGNHQKQQQQHPQQRKKKVDTYHSSTKPSFSAPSTSTQSAVSSSNTSNATKPAGKKFSCPVCGGEGHPLRACQQFLDSSPVNRRITVNRIQHCANCLAYNHIESKCTSPRTCFTCGERHHSLLHGATTSTVTRTAAHVTAASSSVVACNTQTPINSSSHVLLATAIVNVIDANGEQHALRALIDQGSEANFITESSASALRLPKQSVRAVIN